MNKSWFNTMSQKLQGKNMFSQEFEQQIWSLVQNYPAISKHSYNICLFLLISLLASAALAINLQISCSYIRQPFWHLKLDSELHWVAGDLGDADYSCCCTEAWTRDVRDGWMRAVLIERASLLPSAYSSPNGHLGRRSNWCRIKELKKMNIKYLT